MVIQKINTMKTPLFSLILLIFLGWGCSSDTEPIGNDDDPDIANLYFPPDDSADWETISPDDLGWDTEAQQALYDLLEEKNTKAFIILKDGKLVVEWYFGDHTQNTSWYWASAGKTLTAFTVGIAQEEGLLDINDKTSDYLESGWTSLEPEKENLITVWHQLTMTSGMNPLAFDCVAPNCLNYVADAGSRWAYHNGPYTLLQLVVANATQEEWATYFNTHLRNKIGMDGFWLSTNGSNNVYFSTARSMARFGLLNLANGKWKEETILGDSDFLKDMKNTSQNHNKSYGYLWWLNGKQSHMGPGSQIVFDGFLIPNAPTDTYAGLGKDDQKLYIVPSKGLVVVRMGEDAGEDQLGPSSFDNALWEKLSAYVN